jgi:HAD superfamily hydrolase (TIGR01490 family)
MNAQEKIGAFFDLDGAVVAPPSFEWRFIGFLLARDKLATRDIARWLIQFAKRIAFDPRGAILGNKHYLAGLRTSLAADWESSLADHRPPVYAAALERMSWHWAQGHRVFLVSGTLDFLAHAVARHLPGPVEVCATKLETRNGRWTGRLASPQLSRYEKARAVRNVAAQFGLLLWDSYAYGNATSDLPMLDSVGHRFAVNPSAGLRGIASGEGWPICDWRTLAGEIRVSAPRLAAREAR